MQRAMVMRVGSAGFQGAVAGGFALGAPKAGKSGDVP